MATQPNTCRTCSRPIKRGSITGYCRDHVKASPEYRQRISEAVRSSYQRNPEQRERKRQAARIVANRPEQRALRSKAARESQNWKLGLAARTPESFAKLARSVSNYRLAWCPPELRDEYRHLTNSKGFRAAEARKMIEDLHEAEMQRWRREHGLVIDPVAEIVVKEPRVRLPADMAFVDKVLPATSDLTGISVRDLVEDGRFRHIVRARYVAIYALKRHYGNEMSAPAIGRMFGGRDHTTILHAIKEAEKLSRQDTDFATLVAEVLAA